MNAIAIVGVVMGGSEMVDRGRWPTHRRGRYEKARGDEKRDKNDLQEFAH